MNRCIFKDGGDGGILGSAPLARAFRWMGDELDLPKTISEALLTTTMTGIREVVDLVRQRDQSGKLRVIDGGAPPSQAFHNETGVDGYNYDAAGAVELVKTLVGAA